MAGKLFWVLWHVGLLALPCAGHAATPPVKPARVLVGAPPAGPADFLARLFSDALAGVHGPGAVVENRPGASGTIAARAVARSRPDGHTLLVAGAASTVAAPLLYPKLGYDPGQDLVPVALLGGSALVLVVPESLPARTVQALVALAQALPGAVSYGSSGPGSAAYLCAELFASTVGITMLHVPFSGDAQAQNDLLSGEVQLMFMAPNVALPHVMAGRLRALAVTATQRLPSLPEVPTLEEAGLEGFAYSAWIMAFAPAHTPLPVAEQLAQAWSRAVLQPSMRNRLQAAGLQAQERLDGVDALRRFFEAEQQRLAGVLHRTVLKPR